MTDSHRSTDEIAKDKLREALIASLSEIERLRQTVAAGHQSLREPVAIIGIGLQLPGGIVDLSSLWEMLKNSGDAVGPIPEERWSAERNYDPNPNAQGKNYVRDGAFLKSVDSFDADFFGISPREAKHIDPQHRLLLEATWQALEQAGIVPLTLKQRKTGVFVGIGPSDYGSLQAANLEAEAYRILGTHTSFAAGRIAFTLGLQGPAISVDTACSSSLVALHLACQSLRQNECEIALAAGVQVMVDEALFVLLSRTKALAPDGRSKTFSINANGYGRGEGVVVLALERLSDARALKRNILAVVRGTAVNHDGASSSITAPNGLSQQAVLRAALENSHLMPDDIDVIECHGTGTTLGDPIEVQAIAEVYCPQRTIEHPLQLGALKTNIGHLESASGLAGVAKIIAAMRYQALPPTIHTTPHNPHINWSSLPIRITDSLYPWPHLPGGRLRRAGVSAFGLSGTNAHIILEEPPSLKPVPGKETISDLILPFFLSAKTQTALYAQASQLHDLLTAEPELNLLDLAASLATSRSLFSQRAVIITEQRKTLIDALLLLARGQAANEVFFNDQDLSGKIVHATTNTLPLDSYNLAARYLRGETVDWSTVFSPWFFQRIDLPTYPFQRKRYWIETTKPQSDRSSMPVGRYPLSGQRIDLPDGKILHQIEIGPACQSYLAHHRVYGQIVVPGAFYLSILLSVAESLWPGEAIELRDVQFQRALTFNQSSDSLMLLIQLSPETDKHSGFTATLSAQIDSQWTSLAIASLSQTNALPPQDIVQLDDDHYLPLFSGHMAILERLLAMQVDWGSRWQWLAETIQVDERTTLGHLIAPQHVPIDDAPVPGGLIDNAFAFSLFASKMALDGVPQLPFAVERLYWSGRHQLATWAKHCLRHRDNHASDHTLADIILCNDNGEPLAWLEGVITRRAPAERFFANQQPSGLFNLCWQSLDTPVVIMPNALVLLGDNLSAPYNGYPSGVSVRHHLQMSDLLCSLNDGNPVADVVIFCQPQNAASLLTTAHQITTDILQQLQSWLAEPRFASSQLTIVTQNAIAIDADEDIQNLSQAPIWGLIRSAQNEHPERKIMLLDIDADPSSVSALFSAVFSEHHQLILRRGTLYSPILVASAEPTTSSFNTDHTGTVLLTGGTGTLGALIARHLVTQHHYKSLLLLSRQGENAPGAAALRQELMQSGAQVIIASCDVADKASLAQAMKLIPSDYPLTAVIHLAGVIKDGLVASMTASDLAEVLEPKLNAAVNLDELTRTSPLSAFILFSSLSGLLGTPGQANYAAANAFLDALAQHRHAKGRVAHSLAWGPWEGEGMATRITKVDLARIRKMGISLLSQKQGLLLFDAALNHTRPYAIPMSLNRSSEGGHPLIAPLLPAPKSSVNRNLQPIEDKTFSIRQTLSGLKDDASRYQKVLRWVTNEVASVLELTSDDRPLPERPLQELGLDSLMAVEIKTRLSKGSGLRLPVTLLFDYPTCHSLAIRLSAAIPLEELIVQETIVPVRPETTVPTSPLDSSEQQHSVTNEQLFTRLDDYFRRDK